MQEYTNDEIIKVQMSQRALEGYDDDHDDEPPEMIHERRIAVIGQSPEALEWFVNYNQYCGWLRGYIEGRDDCRLHHAPPF